MALRFGTKAETLQMIDALDTSFRIAPLFFFTVADWRADQVGILSRIRERFAGHAKLVARSSALIEDAADNSMAGAFQSILDIPLEDDQALMEAVDAVIASYQGNPQDQVLIQTMIAKTEASGVIMTHCIGDGAPYYVLNYDDESGRTDSITGGTGEHRTVFVHRDVETGHIDSVRVGKMVSLARELEALFGRVPMDIEFAIDANGEMYLFQARRISLTDSWHPDVQRKVSERMPRIREFVVERSRPRPCLAGSRTIFGNMPDWNPAELIGASPRVLAASLFREIISKAVWRRAREAMGYRLMPPEELMVLVAGKPYIDVRCSFNSFLPAGLKPDTEERLVNTWLDRLDQNPSLHDKVEFEVAQTVLDFTFDEVFRSRYPGLLSDDEAARFRRRLHALTRNCLDLSESGSIRSAWKSVETLAAQQKQRAGRPLHDPEGSLGTLALVSKHLKECKPLGTLPFSIIARHAFMSESLLRSAVARNAVTPERVLAFKRSVRTVMGQFTSDLKAVCDGAMAPDSFMVRYGHLRPGTFDILSMRYDQRQDLFSECHTPEAMHDPEPFALASAEEKALNALLAENGLDVVDAHGLLEYARLAIQGREYAKFVFTRNLSDAIEGLALWGEAHGLTRDDVSHLPISAILDTGVAAMLQDQERQFLEMAERNRREQLLAGAVKLSYIIRDVRDISVVPIHRSAPNFITDKRIEGKLVHLSSSSPSDIGLYGKIVCIENADPGFDWIFTKGIKGLITKYGGANSHMAIRCAEFGLPAAIGCGELTFGNLVHAGSVELNCADAILRPIINNG